MPTIKDFHTKKRGKKAQESHKAHKTQGPSQAKIEREVGKAFRRRPGRPESEERSDFSSETEHGVEYVSTTMSAEGDVNNESLLKAEPLKPSEPEGPDEALKHEEPFRLEFLGSELLRQKAPKAFDLAEAVVEDWVKDGDFRTLPLGNPWVQVAASQGLQQMKKVEKKLDEIGVFSLAQMGLAVVKAKLKIKD